MVRRKRRLSGLLDDGGFSREEKAKMQRRCRNYEEKGRTTSWPGDAENLVGFNCSFGSLISYGQKAILL